MEANMITTQQLLKSWAKREKGPVESQMFNLTRGLKNLGVSIWNVIKTFGLLLASVYCWIAKIRMTPKLKPWVTLTIELAVFFVAAMIPIFNLYVENVQLKDRHSYESYQIEKQHEQEIISAEATGYQRGLDEAKRQMKEEEN